ncbi:regulator of microtubule dynamics protein 1-like isoform X2 [Cylas formicarius]|uniref:regulator of microtubule dynamics protein 1-like isoform X2 n=1 Tax=Cylas formicarius TaxID=197179 RepID=UPI0029586388|nr:regulator of microtubule dynamics protein 1-like isoform X2 [Cylas formicarius]
MARRISTIIKSLPLGGVNAKARNGDEAYRRIPPGYLRNGAAVLGVVGAAGLFLAEHYRQEKVRHAMARDLARMDRELRSLRTELHQLQNQKSLRVKKSNKSTVTRKVNSTLSTASEDYSSAASTIDDSSDLEFYDLSEDDADVGPNLERTLHELDDKLDGGTSDEVRATLQKLQQLQSEYPNHPELLYRIGKAHYRLAEKTDDKDLMRVHIDRGVDACASAVPFAPNHPEVHKWYAVLIGSRADYQSIHNKVGDAHLFKKHVDTALSLNPHDPSLHHMLGRFDYEIAGLKWYERKIAAALFGEPPRASYSEAFDKFMEAERLANTEWKENRLMLAKCKISMAEYKEAVEWLEKADLCRRDAEDKLDSEIKVLLEKYNGYR